MRTQENKRENRTQTRRNKTQNYTNLIATIIVGNIIYLRLESVGENMYGILQQKQNDSRSRNRVVAG